MMGGLRICRWLVCIAMAFRMGGGILVGLWRQHIDLGGSIVAFLVS